MDYTDPTVMKDTSSNFETSSILPRDYHKQSYADTKTYQSTLESQNSYLNHQTDRANIGMSSDRLFKLNSGKSTWICILFCSFFDGMFLFYQQNI